MKPEELNWLLERIPSLKITLIGDGCVDIYWHADMRLSELSREVPQYPLPIVREELSLGAGGNVLANLAALGAENIRFVGCIGQDWRGEIFRKLLADIRVSDSNLVISDSIVTAAYCKPIRHGISPVTSEAPRLDFANWAPIGPELEERVLAALARAAEDTDILIVCDQFANGCITDRVIEAVNALGERMPVIVDSRSRIGQYRNVTVKPNEVEACACLGEPLETLSRPGGAGALARKLEQRTGKPALITLGEQGAVWCENGTCTHVPAVPVEPPIDFVGAGDAFLAGFSLACAQGASAGTALEFANLVASVTIKKLGTTGTASPSELHRALARIKENEDGQN